MKAEDMEYRMAYNVLACGIFFLIVISFLLNFGEAGLMTVMVIYVILLGCLDKEEKDIGKRDVESTQTS